MTNPALKITDYLAQLPLLIKVFGAVVILSILTGIATGYYFLAGIPAALILGYVALVDFRKIFFLLIILIPFSTEIGLPGGFNTDLPAEPLMVILMGIYLLYVLQNAKTMSAGFVKHPITILLFLHLGWILVTALTSELFFVSFKFFLAKTWYYAVFYFMAGSLLKTEKDFKTLFWCLFIPLSITILYVLARYLEFGFAFKHVNKVVRPFYRNHVNYACLMALFFPFLWFARYWVKRWSLKWWMIIGGLVLILVGIQFSYTRAAYVAIMLAAGTYFIIQFRLMKIALGLGMAFVLLIAVWWSSNNNFMAYAPNFERTITHNSFDNLLEATYKGEDISTMERVYRWVAGMQMVKENPWLGFGPGNFPRFYKSYTVTNFETYVSDNPEQSGIHNYYFMVLVEQGLFGFLIFIALSFYILTKGEHIYHQTRAPSRKRIIMTVILAIIIVDALLLMNDMIETDKVGAFFFICIAVLVNMDLANKNEQSLQIPSSSNNSHL